MTEKEMKELKHKRPLTEVKKLKKYSLYIYNPDYNDFRFCANITKQQAEDFLKELSKYNTMPESCCFGRIKAMISTNAEICVNVGSKLSDKFSYDRPEGQMTIRFDDYGYAYSCDSHNCKCEVKSCLWNIKHGKCQDETIRNTIGKILFKKAYSKAK